MAPCLFETLHRLLAKTRNFKNTTEPTGNNINIHLSIDSSSAQHGKLPSATALKLYVVVGSVQIPE